MSHSSSEVVDDDHGASGGGLAERVARTRRTIAASAARLAVEHGVNATTVAQIAEAADVGRATFFRYFDTKELAIAEGLAGDWSEVVVDAIRRQPADLSAMQAVAAAFRELEPWFPAVEQQLMAQLRLARESRAVHAWILELEGMVEHAIAAAVVDRFDGADADDPRPYLVGAMTLAASRHAMERWVDSDGAADLHGLTQAALAAATIG